MPGGRRTRDAKLPADRAAPTSSGAAPRRIALQAKRHDLSRTQLLDAAEVVFGDKGVHDATIKEIAELAEYSVGSVYSYFSGKDDLIAAVMARRGVEMMAGIEQITAGDGSPLQRLVELACFEVGFFASRPAFARLYLRTAAVGPLVPDSMRATRGDVERAMSLTAGLMARGQRCGEIAAGPPLVLARVLSGMVTAYQTVASGGGPGALDGFGADQLAVLVVRAFGAPGGPASIRTDRSDPWSVPAHVNEGGPHAR